MKINFKPGNIIESLKKEAVRFPGVVAFVALLTVLLLVQEYLSATDHELLDRSWFYYAASGMWVSLMFHLWLEECENKRAVLAAFVVAHILLAIDAYHFYVMPSDYLKSYGVEIVLARVAVFVSCGVLSLVLPFLKKNDDIESANFTIKLVVRAVQCGLVALVGALGWSLLYWGTISLFGIDTSLHKAFYELLNVWPLIVLGITIPLLIFIARIPEGENKHVVEFEPSKFYTGILRYLFIPLVGCFAVVLYIYLGKIILEWSLPKGGVVSMVSSMMAGVTLVVVMLYPVVLKGGNKFDKFVMRYLPIASLPLVMLMTLGLVRRFCDYGISVNRLYVAAFCLYCFVLCIGLIVSKAKRINFIPLSFCVLFLITSAHPFNIVSSTCSYMYNDLKKTVEAYPPHTTPMDSYMLNEWLYSLPDSSGMRYASYIDELISIRGGNFDTLLVEKCSYYGLYSYKTYKAERDTVGIDLTKYTFWNFPVSMSDTLVYCECPAGKYYEVPSGYKYMRYMNSRMCCMKDSLMHDNYLWATDGAMTLKVDVNPLLSMPLEQQRSTNEHYLLNAQTVNGHDVVCLLRDGSFALYDYRGLMRLEFHVFVFYNDPDDF